MHSLKHWIKQLSRGPSTRPASPAHPPIIERLEGRELFSVTLKVVSITPVKVKAPAVHVAKTKTPKVVKVTPKKKAPAPKKKATPITSGGEKHVDYGVSQFT